MYKMEPIEMWLFALSKEENCAVGICVIRLQYFFMISKQNIAPEVKFICSKVGVAASANYLCEW